MQIEDQEFARLKKAIIQAKEMLDIDPQNETFKRDYETAIVDYEQAKCMLYFGFTITSILSLFGTLICFYVGHDCHWSLCGFHQVAGEYKNVFIHKFQLSIHVK